MDGAGRRLGVDGAGRRLGVDGAGRRLGVGGAGRSAQSLTCSEINDDPFDMSNIL